MLMLLWNVSFSMMLFLTLFKSWPFEEQFERIFLCNKSCEKNQSNSELISLASKASKLFNNIKNVTVNPTVVDLHLQWEHTCSRFSAADRVVKTLREGLTNTFSVLVF